MFPLYTIKKKHILSQNSYDQSTKAYVPEQYTPKYYEYSRSTEAQYNQNSSPATTAEPYKYFYYSTTRNPIEYNFAETKSTAKVTYPPSINKYSITSTKSPYDFKDFTTRTYKSTIFNYEKSTEAPKRGFYSKEDFDKFFQRSTTKEPYYQSDKGVKSVFKIGTLYSRPKASDNSIRPDANSQQVQIEPARLVYSYQRNLTTGEIIQP